MDSAARMAPASHLANTVMVCRIAQMPQMSSTVVSPLSALGNHLVVMSEGHILD